MTEHLLDLVLSRAAAVLGLAFVIARIVVTGARPVFARVGGLLVIAGTLGQLLAGANEIAGTLTLVSIADVVRGTSFGSSAAAALGAGVVLAAVLPTSRRRGSVTRLAGVAAAMAFALALSAQGHGAATPGRTLVQAVHVAAASAWIGGLLVLAESAERGATSAHAVTTFSRIALWLVIVLGLSGILRAHAHVAFPSTELASDYGRVLVLKLVFGAGALGFAVRHRRVTLPRLANEGAVPRTFGRDVTAELVLAVCAVLAAAALGQLPPPRE